MSATQDPPEPSAPEPAGTSEGASEAPVEAGKPDAGLDRLYAQMEQMGRTQQQFMDRVTQQLAPPEEEEEEDDSLFYDDEGGLTEEGARALIRDLVNEQVNAQLAPREAKALVARRDQAYEQLREDFPELQDDNVANQVIGRAIEWARQSGLEDLIQRPEFVDVIEAFYKADKYESFAQTQAAEQPREVVLESGRGAARQQVKAKEPDWGERIVEAAARLHPRI